MMDMTDINNEIQESLGRSYSVLYDIDEDELLGGTFQSLSTSLNCGFASVIEERINYNYVAVLIMDVSSHIEQNDKVIDIDNKGKENFKRPWRS
ncbi:hypothetical protein Tco_1078839 [Tanacetum coccineum]|uniref:Uncharacterized protein n=1 Tax=Tanacetum coccineum TaxID=301880 RepID=A0ABQ5HQ94_9ASTR